MTDSSGFPKFQMSLDYPEGMFTLRADNFDEFVEGVTTASGSQEVAEAILQKIQAGFRHLLEVPPRDGRASLTAGGVKSEVLSNRKFKLCDGHGKPMTAKIAKTGPNKNNKFWSCNGKDAQGQPAWRSGEGCKPADYTAGEGYVEEPTPQEINAF